MSSLRKNTLQPVSPVSLTPEANRTRKATTDKAAPINREVFQFGLNQLLDKINTSFKNELQNAIQPLEAEIADIKENVDAFGKRITALESRQGAAVGSSSLQQISVACDELRERCRRAANVILVGLAEITEGTDELVGVNTLLSSLGLGVEARQAVRLGGNRGNRARPLKLVFESEREVFLIFKNKRLFASKNLIVKNDQTPREREYLAELRGELQRRIDEGESNLTIRYVNHTPAIVSKNVNDGNTQ